MVSKKSVGSAALVLDLGALGLGGGCSSDGVVNPGDDDTKGGSSSGGASTGGVPTGGSAGTGFSGTSGASSGTAGVTPSRDRAGHRTTRVPSENLSKYTDLTLGRDPGPRFEEELEVLGSGGRRGRAVPRLHGARGSAMLAFATFARADLAQK